MGADTRDLATDIGPAERLPDAEHRIENADQLSHAITEALAAALDCETFEVPPLHDTVDLDALAALFGSQYDGTPRTGGRVAFVHGDCDVVVTSGVVRVYRH